jgi:DNA-binding winged helix-turn-helix (wHTH) protein
MRFRFGNCELDTETRELLRGGSVVHLSPKGFQFLELLISERPRALPKTEIHEKLWPGTFVTDGTLTSLLAEVRAAIEDEAHESKFVRTVHRFGYAFSGEAKETKAKAPAGGGPEKLGFAYRLFAGPREVALEEGETILGRDPEATVFLDHGSVSRRHARIVIHGGSATIEDLDSKNGTRVGGERITGPRMLADGDAIRIGSVRLDFRVFPLSGSTETASSRS